MAEEIRGSIVGQVVRKTIGSPGVWFEFADVSNSFMIDNLDSSSPVYFDLAGSAVIVGSNAGIVPAAQFRSFDLRAGSVNVMASGTSSSEVQVVRIT